MLGAATKEPRRRSHAQLAATTILLTAIAFGLCLTTVIAWNRAYQVDEVEHIHAAYNMRDGRVLYRDFWQSHTPLLYVLLVPVIDIDDPVWSYHGARLVSLALLLALLALVTYGGWRFAGAGGAIGSLALALFHTTFIERGIEVRPDGALAVCVVGALAVELAQRRDSLARYSLQAVILGTGLLLTQKAVFATAVFGCLWLHTAWREQRVRIVAQPLALWFLPLGAALLVMLPFGCANEFLEQGLIDAFFAGTGVRSQGRFSPWRSILFESARNPMFLLLAVCGVALWFRRRETRFVALLAVALVAALWANPFPWPYVHLSVLPILAIAGGCALAAVGSRWPVAAVGAFFAVIVTSGPRLLRDAERGTDQQFAMLREIARVTRPEDRLFDLDGLYFRPDAYPSPYIMGGDLLGRYAQGQFPRIAPVLRRNACAGVILNYRTAALGEEERAFIREHYAHYWRNLYLPGVVLDGAARGTTRTLGVLQRREFRYDGRGAIRVDGAPFARGILEAGDHDVVVVASSDSARLIIATPEPVPQRLAPAADLYATFD